MKCSDFFSFLLANILILKIWQVYTSSMEIVN